MPGIEICGSSVVWGSEVISSGQNSQRICLSSSFDISENLLYQRLLLPAAARLTDLNSSSVMPSPISESGVGICIVFTFVCTIIDSILDIICSSAVLTRLLTPMGCTRVGTGWGRWLC